MSYLYPAETAQYSPLSNQANFPRNTDLADIYNERQALKQKQASLVQPHYAECDPDPEPTAGLALTVASILKRLHESRSILSEIYGILLEPIPCDGCAVDPHTSSSVEGTMNEIYFLLAQHCDSLFTLRLHIGGR